jgi:hypothetical protein
MSGPPRYDRSVSGPLLVVSIPPPVRSVLHVSNVMRLESPDPPPHWWLRFWQRVLLGWRWERVP